MAESKIGAGSSAKSVHPPNLEKLSRLYSIHAIVSATGSNVKETAKRFKAAYSSTDCQDVLDDDIDMAATCARHNLHADYMLEALKDGKNVFVEKPPCVTLNVVEALKLARKKGLLRV